MWIKELQMRRKLCIQSIVYKTLNEDYHQRQVDNCTWHIEMQYQITIQKFDEKSETISKQASVASSDTEAELRNHVMWLQSRDVTKMTVYRAR